jgi:hypothetical protein
MPLHFTDAELDQIFAAAQPLDPDLRDPFLRAVACALQGREIGPGLVARVCRELQREFYKPIDEGHHHASRWSSKRANGVRG